MGKTGGIAGAVMEKPSSPQLSVARINTGPASHTRNVPFVLSWQHMHEALLAAVVRTFKLCYNGS